MDPTSASGEKQQHQPSQQESHQPSQIPQCEQRTKTPSREPTGETARKPVRKAKVKWPKASDIEEWRSFDQSLHTVLQNLIRGSITAKLNIFGDIIHEEGKVIFGELPQRKAPLKQSRRREREILQLVKEHCLFRKAWRKAMDHEKEGLKNLWGQIRTRLTNLRRAERIRKRRSRKEKARSSFIRDPFKYARGLL